MKEAVLAGIRDEFERQLPTLFAEAGQRAKAAGSSTELIEAFKTFMLRGGRRLRPTLAVFSHQAYARHPLQDIYRIAFALEIVHNFALIHDDLVDKTDQRRGGPAMHTMLVHRFGRGPSGETGARLALIAGDFLYTLGIRMLLSAEAEPAAKQAALKVLMDAALEAAAGEFEELALASWPAILPDRETVLKIYARKTSSYSFCCPLVIGALLAGIASSETARLHDVGQALGQAYQIHDDLADLHGDNLSGGNVWGDFQERKPTLLLALAAEMTSEEDAKRLMQLLHAEPVSAAASCMAREIVKDCGAPNAAARQAEGLLQEARMLAQGLAMSQDSVEALFEYVSGHFSTPMPVRT